MQRISWSHSIALLHYCNTLIRFALRLMIPSQKSQDKPNLWLANQIFHNNLRVYPFMYYHVSSLIYCPICFTFYHYINHWCIQFLCLICMMNVVRIWQGNIVLRNISDVTMRIHWMQLHRLREKSLPFQKKYKKEIFHLISPHFNFWLAIEKFYYLPISTCSFRRSSFCSLWGNMVQMDLSINFRGRPFAVK